MAAEWHCVLDTTVFFEARDGRDELSQLAVVSPVQFYVCEVSLIERKYQLIEKGLSHSDAEAKVQATVRELNAGVIPVTAFSVDELRASMECLGKAGTNIGFDDACILLTAMKYADENSLGACTVHSNNYKDFGPAMAALRSRSKTKWLYVEKFADLLSIGRARRDTVFDLQAFIEAHSGEVLAHVEDAYKPAMIESLLKAISGPAASDVESVDDVRAAAAAGRLRLSLRDIGAVHVEPPEEQNAEHRISLRVTVDMHPPGMLHVSYHLSGAAVVTYRGGKAESIARLEQLSGADRPSI